MELDSMKSEVQSLLRRLHTLTECNQDALLKLISDSLPPPSSDNNAFDQDVSEQLVPMHDSETVLVAEEQEECSSTDGLQNLIEQALSQPLINPTETSHLASPTHEASATPASTRRITRITDPLTVKPLLYCPVCYLNFSTWDPLKEHLHGAHPCSLAPVCHTCQGVFDNTALMLSHECFDFGRLNLPCAAEFKKSSFVRRQHAVKLQSTRFGFPPNGIFLPRRCGLCYKSQHYFTTFLSFKNHKSMSHCSEIKSDKSPDPQELSMSSSPNVPGTESHQLTVSDEEDVIPNHTTPGVLGHRACRKKSSRLSRLKWCRKSYRNFRPRRRPKDSQKMNIYKKQYTSEIGRFVCSTCPTSFRVLSHLRAHYLFKHGHVPPDLSRPSGRCPVSKVKRAVSNQLVSKAHSSLPHSQTLSSVITCPDSSTDLATGVEENGQLMPDCHADDHEIGSDVALKRTRGKRKRCRLRNVDSSPSHTETCEDFLDAPDDLPYKISSGQVTCLTCDKSYINFFNYTKHYKQVHQQLYQYSCGYCDFRVNDRYSLDEHLARHFRLKQAQCPFCDARFIMDRELRDHVAFKHNSDRNYRCSECDATFKTAGTLSRHRLVHGDRKVHACLVCGVTCNRLSNLNRHIKRKHPNRKQQRATANDNSSQNFSVISELPRSTVGKQTKRHRGRSNRPRTSKTTSLPAVNSESTHAHEDSQLLGKPIQTDYIDHTSSDCPTNAQDSCPLYLPQSVEFDITTLEDGTEACDQFNIDNHQSISSPHTTLPTVNSVLSLTAVDANPDSSHLFITDASFVPHVWSTSSNDIQETMYLVPSENETTSAQSLTSCIPENIQIVNLTTGSAETELHTGSVPLCDPYADGSTKFPTPDAKSTSPDDAVAIWRPAECDDSNPNLAIPEGLKLPLISSFSFTFKAQHTEVIPNSCDTPPSQPYDVGDCSPPFPSPITTCRSVLAPFYPTSPPCPSDGFDHGFITPTSPSPLFPHPPSISISNCTSNQLTYTTSSSNGFLFASHYTYPPSIHMMIICNPDPPVTMESFPTAGGLDTAMPSSYQDNFTSSSPDRSSAVGSVDTSCSNFSVGFLIGQTSTSYDNASCTDVQLTDNSMSSYDPSTSYTLPSNR